jgi:enoyl-CoA hydratase/carnithine racemase
MYKSIIVDRDISTRITTVTLNRPQTINAISQSMLDDFAALWPAVRADNDINAVIIRGSLDSRGFSSGADIGGEDLPRRHPNVFANTGVQEQISPRMHYVYKPVICAVHGLCIGAGLFLVNDSDLVICSDDAQFFDPHLAIGITSAMGPIGMTRRVNLGEVLRYTLLSNAERLGAETALRVGLVTEVTTRDKLWARADELARIVAAYDTVAVQGTLKAIWESLELGRKSALDRAALYADAAKASVGEKVVSAAPTTGYTVR